MNEENWLSEQETDYTTSIEAEGKGKGKGNNDPQAPLPAWTLAIFIPIIAYVAIKRQANACKI